MSLTKAKPRISRFVWRRVEQAIRLLWIGAEVEHALMVQYLYAAYSLDVHQADEDSRNLVLKWRRTILEIAREEMGHLATVENLLTLIGGPLHFDREDFPINDPDLWPFPFQLEPLTKLSLAKYVIAESPAEKVLFGLGLKDEIDADQEDAECRGRSNGAQSGTDYEKTNDLFSAAPMKQGPPAPPYTDEHPSIATIDIQANNEKYQVTPGAWGLGYGDIYIETAHDRASAQSAIKLISEQGEGSEGPSDLYASHFGKFLRIYREFPEKGAWRPSVEDRPQIRLRIPRFRIRRGASEATRVLGRNLAICAITCYLFTCTLLSDRGTRRFSVALSAWLACLWDFW